MKDATLNNLYQRRRRLIRGIESLTAQIESRRATIAELEAEMRALGVDPGPPPRHRSRSPHFTHGEMPRRCLAVLRAAGEPLRIREIVPAILRAKGLDASDPEIVEWAVKRARDALRLYRRQGVVGLVGNRRWRGVRWELKRRE
jgi:hypothetical protein